MLTRAFYRAIENVEKSEAEEMGFGSLTQTIFQGTLEYVYDDPNQQEIAVDRIREIFESKEGPSDYELTIWTVA